MMSWSCAREARRRVSVWSSDQEHMAELPLLLRQAAAVRLLGERAKRERR